MPASGDSYKTTNPHQQRNLQQQQHHHQQLQAQNSPYLTSQPSISPPEAAGSSLPFAAPGNSFGGVAGQLSTVPGIGSGAGGNYRHRIYAKQLSNSRSLFKNAPNLGASPLLSALSNPTDLFSRSIPSFISSSPGTGSSAQSSLTGSSPSSWPASYASNALISRGIGGSVPQQRGNGTYPSVEEQLSRNTGFLPYAKTGLTLGGSESEKNLTPGESGYVCCFDTLGSEPENVICMGWEGGIDVWKIGKGMLDLLGRLEGLSGGVRGAKILPTPQRLDPLASLRPLIALTLHSPVYNSQEESASPLPSPPTSRPQSAASFSSMRSHRQSNSPPQRHRDNIDWQTSVEIYSLSTRERVAVLFTSPLVSNLPTINGETQWTPPVWGNIKVEVGENSVAVGIGMSGEVYLFTLMGVNDPAATAFGDPLESVPLMETKKRKRAKSRQDAQGGLTGAEWICQAKVWTTVQVPSPGGFASDSSTFNNGLGNSGIGFYSNGIAVFSLQGRWLVYVPPPINTSVSAGGTVRVPFGPVSSSVYSQAPPSPPNVSVSVDMADGEEKLLNRLTREGIQEGIRVAKWVGEQGIKAIQNYWNSSSTGQGGGGTPPHVSAFPEQGSGNGIGPVSGFSGTGGHPMSRAHSAGIPGLGQQISGEKQFQQFSGYPVPMGSPYVSGNASTLPPTYGNSASSNATASIGAQGNTAPHQPGGHLRSAMHGPNDPILVSLLDIGRFPNVKNISQSNAMHWGHQLSPFATFHPPLGVSYVSLAPSGLALLTVSSKGDVYHVWDLLRVVHQKPGIASFHANSVSANVAPPAVVSNKHVRQIARFSRLTVAHTVDVAWSYPRGDRLAVITDKGTVHFYDLPASAYQWPPYKKPPPTSLTGSSPVFNAQQQAVGAVHAVQGAVGLLNSTAQPLLTAARRRRSSSSGLGGKGPSPTGGIIVNYKRSKDGAFGSRANTDNKVKTEDIQSGVTKISLPGYTGSVTPGSVKFLMGRELGYVGMIGGGLLVVYQKTPGGQGGSKKRRSIATGGILPDSGLMYELPLIPDVTINVKKEATEEEYLIEVEKAIGVEKAARGFWNAKHHCNYQRHHRQNSTTAPYRKKEEQQQYEMHPLAFAEIETNPDFVALHEDRRVTLMVFADPDAAAPTTSSVLLYATQAPVTPILDRQRANIPKDGNEKWIFGLPIQVEKLNLGGGKGDVEFREGALDDVVDAMESTLRLDSEPGEYIPRGKTGTSSSDHVSDADGEGIFEGDCEVVDYRTVM